ncbi:DUF2894 domain-containing protein [Xanthomonas medicagonis]|uniref:DUF2894 domain-containing protein n=1 Tax=Xanthomonas medicagonis TaxID=3160841 RepID=UPI003512434F
MRDKATSAGDRVTAWRAQHGARLDPLRWRFIEALARRTDAQQGQARHLLEQRLSARLAAYADELTKLADEASTADAATRADAASTTPRSPLGELLAAFPSAMPNALDAPDGDAPPAAAAAFAPLPALDDARRLWTHLHGRSQLRQSMQQAPSDAGPLNSGVLVHRALALMRTLSPGYLQHFLAYVDTLSWLERMHEDGALASRQDAQAATGKKPARGKPRKRS